MTKKIALFSVSDLTDIVKFAKVLVSSNWKIIATYDAYKKLKLAKIPVERIETFTGVTKNYGFPPTLHPKIEYALTSDKSIYRIELVYDIPYPLSVGNDVGGLTLLALACKGNRIPIFTRKDMEKVIEIIKQHNEISSEMKNYLIAKTNFYIANHYLTLVKNSEVEKFDGFLGIKHCRLLNGENPYQVPSDLFVNPDYIEDNLAIHNFKKVSGELPCFTNIADLDCILTTLCKLSKAFKKNKNKIPFISIAAKHGNPCGVGIDWDNPKTTIEKALWGNPVSIWGGEFITNFVIEEPHAWLLLRSSKREKMLKNASWMLDIVASPGFSDKAVEILGKRPQRKLLTNHALLNPDLPKWTWSYREVRGGFVRQPISDYIIDLKEIDWQKDRLNLDDIDSLLIAWAVAYTSNHGGNEIAIAKDGQLIGVGGGPSTIDAAKIAIKRARENNHEIRGSIFTADAFFPYTDVLETLLNVGIKGGAVPYGGKNINQIMDFVKRNNLKVGFIPEKYRGFCRH